MISLMNYKGQFIIKRLTTYVTFICFSSCMDSLMSSEFWVLKKSYVTLITTVRFFLVCFLVWYQFWGMYNSILLFMRIAFTDTTSSLRWWTWGATVVIHHNLTTFRNCPLRFKYLQLILKAWSMLFNRLISCITSAIIICLSVRFFLWDIEVSLSSSVHRDSKSCIFFCIFLRK